MGRVWGQYRSAVFSLAPRSSRGHRSQRPHRGCPRNLRDLVVSPSRDGAPVATHWSPEVQVPERTAGSQSALIVPAKRGNSAQEDPVEGRGAPGIGSIGEKDARVTDP